MLYKVIFGAQFVRPETNQMAEIGILKKAHFFSFFYQKYRVFHDLKFLRYVDFSLELGCISNFWSYQLSKFLNLLHKNILHKFSWCTSLNKLFKLGHVLMTTFINIGFSYRMLKLNGNCQSFLTYCTNIYFINSVDVTQISSSLFKLVMFG